MRKRMSRTMDSFDISSDSEEGLLDEVVVGGNYHQQHLQQLQRLQYYQHQKQHPASTHSYHTPYGQHYDPMASPIHYCDNAAHSDDNSCSAQDNHAQSNGRPTIRCSSGSGGSLNRSVSLGSEAAGAMVGSARASGSSASVASVTPTTTIISKGDKDEEGTASSEQLELEPLNESATRGGGGGVGASSTGGASSSGCGSSGSGSSSGGSGHGLAASTFNHQLTADICNFKNSKSRRLEYSLKCLKYGRSNPSQDSAFGSLTDNDLSIGSSSFRLNSFQSISSPIDEGVEDVIIATTTAGNETCLELTTMPRNMVSQDSAISSPCRESSPSNFLNIDADGMSGSCSGGSSTSGSTGNVRPQQFPASLSPKILVTTTTNSSNSSLSSGSAAQQPTQQFDPPKILVNDQNSIYTTSPSKRSGTIEVFSQKYRVSSFEDMSPSKRSSSASSDKHLKNVNRLAFRSLEEERRIDSAFMPITDRTNSENRVNMQSEKYKKLTHASFRISKTSNQISAGEISLKPLNHTKSSSNSMIAIELQRPATVSGTSSSRQTLWRDSKFYRKNRIAKSNDSLLETSPNHTSRLSPSSLRDNHYDSCSSYGGSRSHSRQSLNRGGSINEISGSHHTLGLGLAVTTSFCGNPSTSNGRRYCSSKSEDLGESSDYLRVMDARKSYSERHLVTLTKLKQTAINNTSGSSDHFCLSEDEMSFNDDNNAYGYQQQQQTQQHSHKHRQRHGHQKQQQQQQQQQQQLPQQFAQLYAKRPHPNQLSWSSCSINHLKTTNIKTTSLATLSCPQNASSASLAPQTASTSPHIVRNLEASKSLDQALNTTDSSGATSVNTDENSSPEESPSHQTLSGAELSKIFAMDDAQGSSCSEEKTPLLDSVEMSPISPTEPELEPTEQM